MSIDGGLNYSILVSESTPYNGGSFTYNLPAGINATTQARVRMTCIDNECFQFYDVSDSDFSIDSPCAGDISSVCDTEPLIANAGSTDLELNLENIRGQLFETNILRITNTTPQTDIAINNPANTACDNLVPNRSSISMIIKVSEDGTYRFDTDCGFETQSISFFSVFTESNFNPANPCPSFVGSTGRRAMAGSTSTFCSNVLSIELEKCREYRVVFWTFGGTPQNVIMEAITGPGDIYLDDVTNPDYAITYVAIEQSSGIIRAVNDQSNFINLAAGEYNVHSLSYKSGGTTPPENVDPVNLVGLTLIEAAQNGSCIRLSDNFKPVTIETSCIISNVTAGTTGACDPINNRYTQDLTLTYDLEPTSGDLVVNGQIFAITGSPQTVTLENLDSDALSLDVLAFFTEDPSCRREISALITAPDNCCPIDISLDPTMTGCGGEDVELDAGPDGVSYNWSRDGMNLMETSSIIFVEMAGMYSVTVTNGTGCVKTQETIVNFEDGPTLGAVNDFSFCDINPEMITLDTDAESVEVFNSNGDLVFDTFSFEVSAEDSYTVIASGANGCTSDITFEATSIVTPLVDLGPNIVACLGSQVELDAGVIADEYVWIQQGQSTVLSTTSELTVSTPGTYILTASNEGQCVGSSEVTVDFEAGPNLTLPSTVDFCEGESGIIPATTNATDIIWFFNEVQIMGETDFELEVSEAGEYTAQVFGAGGCEVSQTTDVTINELPELDLDGDQTICEGESYDLDVNTGNSGDRYMYTLDGTPLPIPPTQSSVNLMEAGQIEVTITSADDCSVSGTFELNVTEKPEIEITGSNTLCNGETAELTAVSNATSFEWFLDSNPLPDVTATIQISMEGDYMCIASVGSDCSETDFFEVAMVDSPVLDLGPEEELCPGEMTSLDAGNHSSYLWSDGSEDSTLDITAPSNPQNSSATFSVTVTNAEGCTSMDEIDLSYLPTITSSISLSANGVCPDSDVTIMATGGTDYLWDNSSSTLSSTEGSEVTATPTESTIYSVTITDECPGNMSIETIEVPVFTADGISAGVDDCVIDGNEFELQAEGGSSYLWDENSTIVGARDIANPIVMPTETTTYSVLITDSNGCEFRDEVEICVLDSQLDLIKAVSIITPNNDGQNDNLQFNGLESFPDNNLTVFNRWGNVIYEADGYQTDDFRWDGTRQGQPLPAGTYYYVLNFDEFTFKSALTIIYE
jgi:gliding motility-associated-like protein